MATTTAPRYSVTIESPCGTRQYAVKTTAYVTAGQRYLALHSFTYVNEKLQQSAFLFAVKAESLTTLVRGAEARLNSRTALGWTRRVELGSASFGRGTW